MVFESQPNAKLNTPDEEIDGRIPAQERRRMLNEQLPPAAPPPPSPSPPANNSPSPPTMDVDSPDPVDINPFGLTRESLSQQQDAPPNALFSGPPPSLIQPSEPPATIEDNDFETKFVYPSSQGLPNVLSSPGFLDPNFLDSRQQALHGIQTPANGHTLRRSQAGVPITVASNGNYLTFRATPELMPHLMMARKLIIDRAIEDNEPRGLGEESAEKRRKITVSGRGQVDDYIPPKAQNTATGETNTTSSQPTLRVTSSQTIDPEDAKE